jgi:hypothetical protein
VDSGKDVGDIAWGVLEEWGMLMYEVVFAVVHLFPINFGVIKGKFVIFSGGVPLVEP